MLRGVGHTHRAGERQLLDAPRRLDEQVKQLKAVRIGDRLGDLGDLLKELVFRWSTHILVINRFIE